MTSDPWTDYVAGRDEALRVYHETIKSTPGAKTKVDKEATKVYTETLAQLRLVLNRRSL